MEEEQPFNKCVEQLVMLKLTIQMLTQHGSWLKHKMQNDKTFGEKWENFHELRLHKELLDLTLKHNP